MPRILPSRADLNGDETLQTGAAVFAIPREIVMATLNPYTPFNSDTFSLFEGDVTTATAEYVRFVAGAQVQELIGSGFVFAGEGDIVSGTLTQTRNWLDGALQYEISGLSHSVPSITSFFDAGDWQGLLNFLFSGSDMINGSGGNDVLNGYGADDTIFGGAGNDLLRGQQGNDLIYGEDGTDTASYGAAHANYQTVGAASNFTVSGPDGSDTLFGIERLRFADEGIAFDLGAGQAAGNTVRVIGAAFGAPTLQQYPEFVGIGLQFFDAGMSMTQVCELVATQVLRLNDAAFVTEVYTNVVGVAPDAATHADFVALLQGSGGPHTQGQLLAIAADLDLTAQQINLVGLQQSGVEFM
jgi:Ca2+-binding RTX toxin-like protein